MKKELLQYVVEHLRAHRRQRRWQKAVTCLAAVVVFCTTYALILPAITMEDTTYCGAETHEHSEDCYEHRLICGQEESEEHMHTEECYETVLVCEKGEHTNTLSCYSDPNADVESQEVWEQSVADVELTGDWSADVVAIARSQLGYAESSLNYAVEEDGSTTRGYTRYGAWYGDAYADWSAMFVSFCLNYAHVEGVPLTASCPGWVDTLQTEEYGLYRSRRDYAPSAGDLVFFDREHDGSSDHVGLVAELLTDEEGAATEIRTIEGDDEGQVRYGAYSVTDERILGYGALPVNPDREELPDPADERTAVVDGSQPGETPGESETPGEAEISGETAAVTADRVQLAEIPGGEESVGVSHDDEIMPLATTDGIHPLGAVTEDFPISGANLYSIGTSGGTASAVAGVVYTVYDAAGQKAGDFTTTADGYSLDLDGLEPGTYTIEQTDVPSGYVTVSQQRKFTVAGDKWNTAGIFYVYDAKDYALDKNTQVYDYENRIYEEILTGKSGGYDAQIDPGNFVFVVDRSNSMLFPTTLTPVKDKRTGDNLQVYFNKNSNNGTRLNTALNFADLAANDDDGLYYIINDPEGSATVYALWKNGSTWYYLDASYYVKAQEKKDGVVFPDEEGTGNGLLNNAGFSGYYTIYKGSPYTRLTWLKYDLSLIIYQLAALNPNNSVTIITFDSDVRRCATEVLNEEGVKSLINSVKQIATDGGTAQDKGLLHVVGDYYAKDTPEGDCESKHSHLSTDKKNYVVLITDGALNSKDSINGKSPEDNVRIAAEKIRANGKLMTVGLSMEDVLNAQKLLCGVSEGGIATDEWNFLDRSAKDIAATVQNKIWGDLVQLAPKPSTASVTDYISGSFYLVTSDGDVLNEGDWITPEGARTTEGADNAAGQVCKDKDSDAWYIKWTNQTLPIDTPWTAKLYVKAKEDFIGGNAIDTNKSAQVDFLDGDNTITATVTLDTPTVNVRLLPMESFEGEAILFLGDTINRDTDGDGVPEAMEDLTSRLDFKKLIPSGDSVYNKSVATDAERVGCGVDTFTVSYATRQADGTGGQLTAEEWAKLKDGETVTFPYTYDDASSHGPVGYFTLKLVVNDGSECEDCGEHFCDHVGANVLSYSLEVTYTAYGLGEGPEGGEKRPDENLHNGNDGPGTVVGTPGSDRLETGKGIVEASVSYDVSVVDGKITVTKALEEPAAEDTTFTFDLLYQETTEKLDVIQTKYACGTILVPKGETEGTETHVYLYSQQDASENPTEDATMASDDGSLVFQHLKRGSYVVQERLDYHQGDGQGDGQEGGQEDSQDAGIRYVVKEASIVADGTNSPAGLNTAKTTATFHIGYHPSEGGEADNIIYQTGITKDGHHIIYSYEWQHVQPDAGPIGEYHGESYGAVHFLNTIEKEEKKIPVQKLWDAGTGGKEAHSGDTVYIALYKDDSPVLIDGRVQLLKLDAVVDWRGEFTVSIPVGTALEGYSVREVTGITADPPAEDSALIKAVVTNETDKLTVYYKSAAGHHKVLEVGGKGYVVSYGGDLTNGLTVMNAKAYELPESGGAGTTYTYFFGGLLMTTAVGYGYRLRRRRERRGDR